jgi:Holliday junction resolvase RusA-like endonuclease
MSSAQVHSKSGKGEGPLVLPVPQPSEWYYLELHVRPKPKARARVLKSGRSFTPDETTLFEMRVRLEALQADLPYWVNGPVGIACYFTLIRRKDHKEKNVAWSVAVPDRDNLEKSILDALNGVIVRDDEQISFGAQWKMIAPEHEEPMVRLYMFPLSDKTIAGERQHHASMLAETVNDLSKAYNNIERKKQKKAAEAEAKKLARQAEKKSKPKKKKK